ncbi:Rnf-Nqr domain containing protein [Paludicola sp. MB14-C6]|uniref:Rnf-Nqr domain containing protein n=1 Tax=Paludihabitans sp. MB14-C6 TaxID=3070656 RepID=UPI0027DC7F1A|nr:Rnf-Nqr domain containing protein [Paludicola sp. MB14-C6]WMJ23802.1 Rnf-Nqr domain containing protein [Paludicola sp. MB14-C6]
MNSFLQITGSFFKDMLTFALIAIFLENTIFSRAIGTSTVLYTVRKKYNIFLFGLIMTTVITVSSIITYFVNPLLQGLSYRYYITPAIYVVIIGIVYLTALIVTSSCFPKYKKVILPMIHVSTFNCAVLGALLLSANIANLNFAGYIGFGIGTGIGYTIASYFVDLAYERLSSEHVPNAFRGFPITLIYIGIVSLAIYGLIGHELPF